MEYLDAGSEVFEDEDVLTTDWTPPEVIGREDQFKQIGGAIRPVWNGSTPYNMYGLGKTGVGKTEVIDQVIDDVSEKAADEDIEVTFLKVNAKSLETEYQALIRLEEKAAEECEETGLGEGHSTDRLYEHLFDHIDSIGGIVFVVVDEIDEMGEDGDRLLYQLSRARSNDDVQNARIAVIFLANDFKYEEQLSESTIDEVDPKDIFFPSYNADELQDILEERVDLAFRNGNVGGGVVPLAAAMAASDQGNARQGIKLLRKAGHAAQDENADEVTEDHVREAADTLERERVREGILGMSSQEKVVLSAVVYKDYKGELPAKRRLIYDDYESVAEHLDVDALGMESLRRHLKTLWNNGIVSRQKGRVSNTGGWRYEWGLAARQVVVRNALKEDDRINDELEQLIEDAPAARSQR